MKFLAFFAVFFLFVGLSQQIPRFINCSQEFILANQGGCGVTTCHGPQQASGVGCGTWDCTPDRRVGYREADNSKPFPECCGGPICI